MHALRWPATFRRWPVFWLAAAISASGLLARIIPGLSPNLVTTYNDDFAFVLLSGVLAAAMGARARTAGGPEEQRMWRVLALAFVVWAFAELIETLVPSSQFTGLRGMAGDGMYLLAYVAWCLAPSHAPHRPAGWTARQPGWLIEQWATIVFSLALIGDLVVVPLLADPSSPVPRAVSSGLYIAFDLAFVLRLLSVRARAADPEWRRLYGTIVTAGGLTLVLDAIAMGIEHGALPALGGPLYDLAWYTPYLILGVAIGLPARQPSGPPPMHDLDSTAAAEGVRWLDSPLPLYLATFVVVHLLATLSPWMAPASLTGRTVLALGAIVVLLALNLRRQLDLERRMRELAGELDRACHSLAAAAKHEALGRLAGGIAHRMNNLLTSIIGHQELLAQRHTTDLLDQEDLTRIREAATRAALLTSDLLAIGGGGVFLPRRMVMTELLREVTPVLTLGSCSHARLRVETGPPLVVEADPARLSGAITRLLVAACSATPPGDVVEISLAAEDIPAAEAAQAGIGAGRYARLRIVDRGPGADPAGCERIFEPFVSYPELEPDPAGSFGLATVFGVVRQHRGHIRVTSTVGEGTQFDLLLPVQAG